MHEIMSDILEIFSDALKGSIQGPIFFNIFMNDLLHHTKSNNSHNYADDNVLSAAIDNVTGVTKSVETGADEGYCMEWLQLMFANLDKFQARIFQKDNKSAKDL